MAVTLKLDVTLDRRGAIFYYLARVKYSGNWDRRRDGVKMDGLSNNRLNILTLLIFCCSCKRSKRYNSLKRLTFLNLLTSF